VSTEDYQDPVTSRARQLGQAGALVAGHGRIVAEFFDVGQSRTLAWARRPRAAALVAVLADAGRGWDAIVIGEYERAFYGSQYASMAPLFEHYGVQLWMPEAGGRVDYHSEHDEQAMTVLGLSSKREITRTSIRVRTAIAAQTRAGPLPGRSPAVWVPACQFRAAPEQGARRVGQAGAPPRARPRDGARGAVDVRAAAGRAQRGADHPR
jgi:DNA invertase Pin-like site-specific DNA recombinase